MQVFYDEKIIFIEVNKNFYYKGAMGSQLGLTDRVGSMRGPLGLIRDKGLLLRGGQVNLSNIRRDVSNINIIKQQ
jgi:hypothetical protein